MKKKIFLFFSVVFSMFIGINNVKADKACYVCQTSGEYVWEDTSNSSCQNNDWKLVEGVKNKNKCKEECTNRNDCENDFWLAKCEYSQIGGDEKVYIYYNNYFSKLFVGDKSIETIQDENGLFGSCKYGNGIELKDLINEYNTGDSSNKGCPGAVYFKKEAVSGGHGVGACLEYTLSSKGYSPNNGTDKYYSLVKDKIPTDGKKDDFDPTSCTALLGDDVIDLINEVMRWIRIAVPLLLIALGTLDFSKAVFGSKEDDMKKARETFIKRIIASVLVFLSPVLVSFMLDLANNVWSWISPDTCIR